MTDEQIAWEFVRSVRERCLEGVATSTLVAIIAEARSTERKRCLAIVELFTNAGMREDVRRTALAILDEINAG